jgi:carboxynorspermidine decarboxylase
MTHEQHLCPGTLVSDDLPTPHFLISERRLVENLRRIETVRKLSGTKMVLALKCFSTWGSFPILRPYLDGTTGSSPFEVRLGHETFGGETHAYCVGYSESDIRLINQYGDKIIFNSLSQYQRLQPLVAPGLSIGLRLNPGVGYCRNPLADCSRAGSRLGIRLNQLPGVSLGGISGAMFHMNCENDDFGRYDVILSAISRDFATIMEKLSWVSLGGGVSFTADGYPLERFADRLRDFARQHSVQVYLEPGEAVIAGTTDLVVTVLDIIEADRPIAIVDSATETHRLDTLVFGEPARLREALPSSGFSPSGSFSYEIGSCSCLAGDIFGTAVFARPLAIGDRLHILDSGGYTMVKMNWFNGLRMPGIYLERSDGRIEEMNRYDYDDFKNFLTRHSQRRLSTGSDE